MRNFASACTLQTSLEQQSGFEALSPLTPVCCKLVQFTESFPVTEPGCLLRKLNCSDLPVTKCTSTPGGTKRSELIQTTSNYTHDTKHLVQKMRLKSSLKEAWNHTNVGISTLLLVIHSLNTKFNCQCKHSHKCFWQLQCHYRYRSKKI